MSVIEHKDIADPNIHEPKGVNTATSGEVYVANGAGSGSWELVTGDSIDTGALAYGKLLTANGAGKAAFGNLVWKDLIGPVIPKSSGVGAPSLANFRAGQVRTFFYSVGDDGDGQFHIPHDWAPGTDIYFHMHWAHNGTAISGSFVVNFFFSYAKGHQQAEFSAEVAPIITVATPDIATIPQYRHRIDELQLTSSTPSITQINTNIIEPDGLLLFHYDVATIPTITGGTPNEPTILFIDLHYQANFEGTKNKTPNFYS